MKIIQKFTVGLSCLFLIAFSAIIIHEFIGLLNRRSAEKQVLVTETAQVENLQSLNSEMNATNSVVGDGLTVVHDKGATFSMMVSTQTKYGTSSAPVAPPNPYLKK